MISAKKLIKMARKWQKTAATSRKRLSLQRTVTDKGHIVVYTIEGRRFMIPLMCLKREIFRELFRMAEQELGIAISAAIMLPCDASFIEYVILMIQRNATEDLEKAMISSLVTCRDSLLSNEHPTQMKQQLPISSF
ncbi:Auxin-responsive protein SAUR66 [Bienertia sinuspersici]